MHDAGVGRLLGARVGMYRVEHRRFTRPGARPTRDWTGPGGWVACITIAYVRG